MYRQMLEAANDIYSEYLLYNGSVSMDSLQMLEGFISKVRKEDFGILQDAAANAAIFADKQTISYANIHSELDERFSFALFFIPKGGFLPLHDHPSMFVFSKILMGKVLRLSFSLDQQNIQFTYPQNARGGGGDSSAIHNNLHYNEKEQQFKDINQQKQQENNSSSSSSFFELDESTFNTIDMLSPEKNSQSHEGIKDSASSSSSTSNSLRDIASSNDTDEFCHVSATLVCSDILSEGFVDDLDPINKNLHYIEAIEDCVFFDVLLPHYDLTTRFCNYYSIVTPPSCLTNKIQLRIAQFPETPQCRFQSLHINRAECNYFK